MPNVNPTHGPIASFLARLFPPAQVPVGYISLWDRQTKGSVHVPAIDLVGVEQKAMEIDARGHDVYFGVALRNSDLGSGKRGGRADTIAIGGYWMDLDLKSSMHSAENLPTYEQAIELLVKFPFHPSEINHSGHGLQCHWLWNTIYTYTDSYVVQLQSKAFQNAFIKPFNDAGFHVDNTADLARVLRAPGTHNYKDPTSPKQVQSLVSEERRYHYTDLDLRPKIQVQNVYQSTGKPTPSGLSPVEHVKFVLLQGTKPGTKQLFKQIVKAETFSEGERDSTMQRAASAIAFVDWKTPPEELVEILRPSIEAMAREATNGKNPPPTIENAVDKIRRAQHDRLREEAKKEEERAFCARVGRGISSRPPPVGDRGSRDGMLSASMLSEGSGSTPGGGQSLAIASFSASPLSLAASPSLVMTPLMVAIQERQAVAQLAGTAHLNGNGHGQQNGSAKLIDVSGESLASPLEADAGGDTDDGAEPLIVSPYYTTEELENYARQQGCSWPELKQRWVIQQRDRYFVFVNGDYKSSIAKMELEHSLPRDLAPLYPEHIQFQKMLQNGVMRNKTPDELLNGICTVARVVHANMIIKRSYYDSTDQIFHEAVCRKRRLIPRHHPQIQMWLEKLGGKQKSKLLDWLATITRLDRPSCAVYVSGPPGNGKTMLAQGLSRIWAIGGPTELSRILDNFNADLLRCPLIFADEYIPQDHQISAELRLMIASDFRTISKKFADNFPLIGCIRLILCSNNDDMISFDENNGKNDQEAIAGRFLHIQTDEDARTYIQELGGRRGTEGWVDKDMIAEHVLWLCENRPVEMGGRFAVEGQQSEMHEAIIIGNRNSSLVCEWIVRHMMNPRELDSKARKYVIIGDGKVLISGNALTEHWDAYMKHERFSPSTRKMSQALVNLSKGVERRSLTNGERSRYHAVNPRLLIMWSEKNLVGDPETLMSLISGKIMEYPEKPIIN